MKKLFLVLALGLLLSSVTFAWTEITNCTDITVPGEYRIGFGDSTEINAHKTSSTDPYCIKILTDNVLINGSANSGTTAFVYGLMINGSNNLIYGVALMAGGSGGSPPADRYPGLAIKGGSGNKIYMGQVLSRGPYTTVQSPGILLDGAGSDNQIFGMQFSTWVGPAIWVKNVTGNTYIYANDFVGSAVIDNSAGVAKYCAPPSIPFPLPPYYLFPYQYSFYNPPYGNWWNPDVNYTFYAPAGATSTKYNTTSCPDEVAPNSFDIDRDFSSGNGHWAGTDNCPFVPNHVESGYQQDLNGNGVGTACDENEYDMNVKDWDYSSVFSNSFSDWSWVVKPDYSGGLMACGTEEFRPGLLEFLGLGPNVFNYEVGDGSGTDAEISRQLILYPKPFGADAKNCTYPGGPGVPNWGPAGVYYPNYVNISAANCGGGYVAGGVSLTGVGHSFGFNESCTGYLRGLASDQYVEYLLSFNTSDWEMYKYWDNPGLRTVVTGSSVTLDPNTDPYSIMGLVFVNKNPSSPVYGKAVRFGMPVLTTSGDGVFMDAPMRTTWDANCISFYTKIGTSQPGIISTCTEADISRGVNVSAVQGSMEIAPVAGKLPGIKGDVYRVRITVPAAFFASIPADTHFAVSNMQSLADKDSIHAGIAGVTAPQFEMSGPMDLWMGSYLGVVGTSAKFNNVNFKIVNKRDVTNTQGDEGEGLGIGVVGGKLLVNNSIFEATNKPWLGIACSHSKCTFENTDMSGFVDSIVATDSDLAMKNMNLYPSSLSAISGFNQYWKAWRTGAAAWYCSKKNLEFQYNDGITTVDKAIPNGIDPYTEATEVLDGGLVNDIQCALYVDNIMVSSAPGDLISTLLVGGDNGATATINDVTSTSDQGVMVVGTGQDNIGTPFTVLATNLDITSKNCLDFGGAIQLSVDGFTCTGSEGSGPAIGGEMAPGGEWLNEQFDFGCLTGDCLKTNATPKFNNWWPRSVAIKNGLIRYHPTNALAPNYDWADSIMTFDIRNMPGNLVVENIAVDQTGRPIVVYGSPDPDAVFNNVANQVVYTEAPPTGCGSINAQVTSNDVVTNGKPGQQPVNNSKVLAYNWSTGSCAKTVFTQPGKDASDVLANCQPSGSCITVNGACTISGLAKPATYFTVVNSTRWPGKYPSQVVNVSSCTPVTAKFAFLKDPTGKVNPAKSTQIKGSELWIYEPDYVVWNGTEEYYPFIFETPDQTWTVNLCLTAPAGYRLVGDNCMQTFVAGESKAILFKLVETGSVPDKTKVKMSLTSPKGKKYTHDSEVDIRLTENLAKAKGVAIDKNGRLLGKGKMESDWSIVILLSVLGIALLGGLMYIRGRKSPEPEEEPEPEEKPVEKSAKRQRRK